MTVYRENNADRVSPIEKGPDIFWREVDRFCKKPRTSRKQPKTAEERERAARLQADAERHRWRSLAMLALRENAGWSLARIGEAFGQDRGNVSRSIRKIASTLRDELGYEPRMNRRTQSGQPADESDD